MYKFVRTPGYNYNFNTNTGYFERWGFTLEDDPKFSPIGPEILDIEISEVCHGGCKFCYKSNTGVGRNMSFETFKIILDKMPTVLQVALGIGDIDGNPDLWRIMFYCREKGIIPNITINGMRMTCFDYDKLSKLCGAVAVSMYDRDTCYNAVHELTDRGMKQVNIHQLLSKETLATCLGTIFDICLKEPRLAKLNALVFLSVKKKGRGSNYTPVSDEDFKRIIEYCMEKNVKFGFDSCSACKFARMMKDKPEFKDMEKYIEPCESGLFSSYINVEGRFFPCSFFEGTEPYGVLKKGLDVVNCKDFLNNIWYQPAISMWWRPKLLENNRECPIYEV